MATISVGELLVRCLKAEGVELMTGIVDGAHIPILVHTPQYGIRYINAHHEEAAVHIAEGYARVSRRPGVVIGNPTCGTGNMLAGVVSAHGEYVNQVDQLQPALERAVQSGKPAVINVQVDYDLNTRPPGWEQYRKARAVPGY